MATNMDLFIEGKKCTKVVNTDGTDMIDENGNVIYVSESGKLLIVYGKVDNIVYFDKKLASFLFTEFTDFCFLFFCFALWPQTSHHSAQICAITSGVK